MLRPHQPEGSTTARAHSNILLPLARLITGTKGSWILLRPKITQRNEYIDELEDSIKNHAEQLQNRDIILTNHQTIQKTLNEELTQRENTINKMKTRIDELGIRSTELISEKNNHIETLNDAMNHGKKGRLYKLTLTNIQFITAVRYLYSIPNNQLEGFTRALHKPVPQLPLGRQLDPQDAQPRPGPRPLSRTERKRRAQ